jgi:hypothetical protein
MDDDIAKTLEDRIAYLIGHFSSDDTVAGIADDDDRKRCEQLIQSARDKAEERQEKRNARQRDDAKRAREDAKRASENAARTEEAMRGTIVEEIAAQTAQARRKVIDDVSERREKLAADLSPTKVFSAWNKQSPKAKRKARGMRRSDELAEELAPSNVYEKFNDRSRIEERPPINLNDDFDRAAAVADDDHDSGDDGEDFGGM